MAIKIRKILDSHKRKDIDIILCVNCLILKPHTPFQREKQCDEIEYKRKIELIKKELKESTDIEIKTMKDDWIYIQSLLTRGDRRAIKIFYEIHKNASLLKKYRKDIDFYFDKKDYKDFLPWNILEAT